MLSSIPFRTVPVVALTIALVGSAVALGGVAALDQIQDAGQQDAESDVDVQQSTSLRVMHASPDAPPVDVQIDNETVLSDVEFGDVSDYRSLEAGTYNVTIAAADDPDTVVFDEAVTFEPRSVTTVAASGEIGEDANTSFQPVAFEDDAFTPADNESALSVVHLAPDAPPIDVTTDDGNVVLAENVSFQNGSDYVTVPAGDYAVEIREATEGNNGSVVTTVDASLEGGTAYSAFAVGYLNADEAPADTPFEVVLTEDATLTLELPGDQAMDEEDGADEDDADGEDEADDEGEADDEDETDEQDEADEEDEADEQDGAGEEDDEAGAGNETDVENGTDTGNETDTGDGSDAGNETDAGNGADTGNETDGDDGADGDDGDTGDGDADDGDAGDGDDSAGEDTAEGASARTIDQCTTVTEPGTYEMTEDIADSSADVCLAIEASDVTIEGNGHAIEGGSVDQSVGVRIYDPAGEPIDGVTVRDLTITNWFNGIQVGSSPTFTPPDAPAMATLQNVEASSNGHHGVYLSTGGDTQLSSVTANGNGASGVGIFDTSGVRASGITVTDNGEHGLALFEGVFDGQYSDVTATGNGGAGTFIGIESTGNQFSDVTVEDNDGSPVEGYDSSDNTFDDPPEGVGETDDESGNEVSDENGSEDEAAESLDGNESAEDAGEPEGDEGAGDEAEPDDDAEVDEGNETDTGDGTEGDDGTGADDETEGDDGSDTGNETDTGDGVDARSDTDAGDETDDGDEPDAGDETEAGDETTGNVTS